MKNHIISHLFVFICCLLFASCHSQKQATDEQPRTSHLSSLTPQQIIEKVNSTAQTAQFISSKMKFSLEYGSHQISLSGNLRMKRNEVIRLQLMAFGVMEAGRLEFTKDSVLIMDRVNKQYIKAPYSTVGFLRNNGINFYTLQALFWGELPDTSHLSPHASHPSPLNVQRSSPNVQLSTSIGKMNYSWLADEKSGRINTANIAYRDAENGNSQLNWNYRSFDKMGDKQFPNDMGVVLITPEKEVKLDIRLTGLSNESDWESRTAVSDKYREVTAEEILRHITSL